MSEPVTPDTKEEEEAQESCRNSERNSTIALCVAGFVPIAAFALKFYAALHGFPLELNEGALYAGYGAGIASILGYRIKDKLVVAKKKLESAKKTIAALKPSTKDKETKVKDASPPPPI